MKMGKYLLTTLAITGLIGFIGCDDADDDKKGGGISGNWILVYQLEEETYDGETDTWEETYDDIRYAMIIKFTATTIEVYENDICSVEWGAEDEGTNTYTLEDGNKMIIIWSEYDAEDDTTYTDEEEFDYTLSGNDLTLSETWTDSSGTETETWLMRFERYTGSFPPSEWTTTLSNDTYEPDNDVASATSLTVGGAEQSHVLLINDEDWFTFSADSGTAYIIATSGNMDTELYLYNADDTTELAYNDDYDDMNARIDWTCTGTGTYPVKAQAYDPEYYCGEYGISVSTGSGTAKAIGLRKEKKTVRHGLFRH